jgi:hypothetical protein
MIPAGAPARDMVGGEEGEAFDPEAILPSKGGS